MILKPASIMPIRGIIHRGQGRFLTPDRWQNGAPNALTLPGNWNQYAYVGGDPINKTDPSGLCSPQDDPPCYSVTGTGYYGGPGYGGGGFGGGGGGDGEEYDPRSRQGSGDGEEEAPRPECDRSNAKNSKYLDFINAHLNDALKLAQQLGVAVQDILGVAAEESAFGSSNLAANGNFFGLHSGSSPFPGQTGTYFTHPTTGKPVSTPTFDPSTGFMDSGSAFVNLEKPWLSNVYNPRDPTTFATIIHQHGYGVGNVKYVKDTVSVINDFGKRVDCEH